MKRLASSLLCIAVLALTLAGAGPSRPAGDVVEVRFRSVAISGKLRLPVYLPHGYDHSRLRYPVVYYLHGLPAHATAYRGIDFLRRALDQSRRGALVVARREPAPATRIRSTSTGGLGAGGRRRSRRRCRSTSIRTSGRSPNDRAYGPCTRAAGSSSR
ncbi:MAG: hypothetical protein WAQ33_12435 [Gaiellaceae bacterium]